MSGDIVTSVYFDSALNFADTIIKHYAQGSLRWHYETGVILKAVWEISGMLEEHNFYKDYVKAHADFLVTESGEIKGYKKEEYNLDQVNTGKVILELYDEYKEDKYLNACRMLINQLKEHPRTELGGYWHKKIYPHQIWLDGLYMYGPFAVRWGKLMQDDFFIKDVVKNLIDISIKAKDSHTGLLKHAWDEKSLQLWANPQNGQSPYVWGRAMGWYCMALVDVMELLMDTGYDIKVLADIFYECISSVIKYRDALSGMWYQIIDQGGRQGNYPETSCSAMFCYSIAKAYNLGLMHDESFIITARESFDGILKRYVRTDDNGDWHLGGICKVAGLGGSPYRDGSFEYYVGEPVVEDDFKGVGPFIMAALELHRAESSV